MDANQLHFKKKKAAENFPETPPPQPSRPASFRSPRTGFPGVEAGGDG